MEGNRRAESLVCLKLILRHEWRPSLDTGQKVKECKHQGSNSPLKFQYDCSLREHWPCVSWPLASWPNPGDTHNLNADNKVHKIKKWWCSIPGFVPSRIPFHDLAGWGGRNLRSPTGGAAYGMAMKAYEYSERSFSWAILPCTRPLVVWATGPGERNACKPY